MLVGSEREGRTKCGWWGGEEGGTHSYRCKYNIHSMDTAIIYIVCSVLGILWFVDLCSVPTDTQFWRHGGLYKQRPRQTNTIAKDYTHIA